MNNLRKGIALGMIALCSATFASAGPADKKADAKPRKVKPLKIKLKDLDGEIWRDRGEWVLRVDFCVKIKGTNARTHEPLVLLVDVTDHKRPMLQEDGLPLQLLIELEEPTKEKANKVEYEDALFVSLGRRLDADPDEIGLHAEVRSQQTNRLVARDETGVDFDDNRGGRGIRGMSRWGLMALNLSRIGW